MMQRAGARACCSQVWIECTVPTGSSSSGSNYLDGGPLTLKSSNLNEEPFSGPIKLQRPSNHQGLHGRARASPNPPLTKGLPNRFGVVWQRNLGKRDCRLPFFSLRYLYPYHPSRPSSTSPKQLLFFPQALSFRPRLWQTKPSLFAISCLVRSSASCPSLPLVPRSRIASRYLTI